MRGAREIATDPASGIRAPIVCGDLPKREPRVNRFQLNSRSWQVNYSRNKAKYLIKSSAIILDKYGGEIPDT